ncbi:MAG: hypothetical protein HOE48_02710 [Candidatus Latescibacteria bacterium]|jgi:hypothetical protein|nr:hypothetical protein [Candidatus Latescibacterota bacterium]MBT5828950.1 hypothetical protein [Candidatus Latescibacterota bacterium]
MHLKPINRQGKKRRKLKNIPSLSCSYNGHNFHIEEDVVLPQSPEAKTRKKDKAAA